MEKYPSRRKTQFNSQNKKDRHRDRDHHNHDPELFTDSDMAAAQQLIQLSDEENCNNVNKNYKENMISSTKDHDYNHDDDQEIGQFNHHRNQSLMKIDNGITERITTWAKKIEEIFGKEDEEEVCTVDLDHDHLCRPPGKKRKYRSLDSIYSGTKPMNVEKKKIISRQKS